MFDSLNNPSNLIVLGDLQARQKAWEEANFGLQPAWTPLFGIAEEYGELAHAVLKLSQSIRGSRDKHIADAKDAIADCLIYALGFCNRLEVDAANCVAVLGDYFNAQPVFTGDPMDTDWPVVVETMKVPGFVIGQLMRYEEVPSDRDKFLRTNIGQLFWTLDKFSRAFTGDGALSYLIEVWETVEKRNWKEAPSTGVVPVVDPLAQKRAELLAKGVPEMRIAAILEYGEDPRSPGYPVGFGCGSHD